MLATIIMPYYVRRVLVLKHLWNMVNRGIEDSYRFAVAVEKVQNGSEKIAGLSHDSRTGLDEYFKIVFLTKQPDSFVKWVNATAILTQVTPTQVYPLHPLQKPAALTVNVPHRREDLT